jgi:D-beta-D-heptose 7-phosphate kinase/D-beta-D-heptose 1-phosphate adenosyltransferase
MIADMIHKFSALRILVVGDIMLDRYVHGHVDRISPEAPVPVLKVEREESRIGGAGTVLRNIAALGGNVTLVTAIGTDNAGEQVIALLKDETGLVRYHLHQEETRTTPVKTRLLAGHHQIARMDSETTEDIQESTLRGMLEMIRKEMLFSDAVVLSDYGKGTVTGALAEGVIAIAGTKPVIVDSKTHILGSLRGASIFTPNLHELAKCTGLSVTTRENIINRCRELIGQYGIKNILATRGAEGMLLQTEDGRTYDYSATATGVVDVTGAGDTVVAMMALALASGLPLPKAAELANRAAGVVVGKVGSATLTLEELGYLASN